MIPESTVLNCHISQEMIETIQILKENFQLILKENLIGIYLHGSIALEDFNFKHSDIDMLVVTINAPSETQKKEIIDLILAYENYYPKKGLEISFVRIEDCKHFVYPTPFDLHFSNLYLNEAKKDSATFSKKMHGLDPDLACHFTLTREKGVVLFGPEPKQVFASTPKKYYLKVFYRI